MLIVAENLVDLIAVFPNVGAKSFPGVVAAKNHEDVLVLLDKLLPHLLAGVTLWFDTTVRISRFGGVNVSVRKNNDAVFWVFGDDGVCPVQYFIPRFAFERDDKKTHSRGLKLIPRIVVLIRVECAAKLVSLCELVAREVCVEMGRAIHPDIATKFVIGLHETHVMISDAHDVWYLPI